MKNIIITLFLFCSINTAFSIETSLFESCVVKNGIELYDKMFNLPIDSISHCSMTCILQKRCDRLSAFTAGILKEIVDLFGPGNAEISDIDADILGISIALNVAESEDDCIRICTGAYTNYLK